MNLSADNTDVPLCVDLDGTLIRSDLLLESFLVLLKRNPLYLLLVPFWLLAGKAALKARIAQRVTLNAAALPYNAGLLAWLRGQRDAGRALWLCTASNHRLADAVAAHLQMFSGVIASSDEHNLSGHAKAQRLAAQFGERTFDYCGNERVDVAIWRVSRAAIVVGGGPALRTAAAQVAQVAQDFPGSNDLLKPAVRAMRLHQWAKNILVFVPLATAHKLTVPALIDGVVAFVAFGLCASSVYLLNDMLDLEADRQHPRKSQRPFASGELSLLAGFVLSPLLLLAAIALASTLAPLFGLVLAGYYLLTLAYSFYLKRLVLVDTVTLAGLYTVRIVAGAAAVSVALSFWLLLFSTFIFFSLALVKRYAELDAMQRAGRLAAAGRGYHVDDLPLLHAFGTAAGYLAVLVLALYINSPAVELLYRTPEAFWVLCVLLLYWISRIWLKAHRGEMHDDPVVFAIKDRVSLVLGVIGVIAAMLAV